MFKQIPSHVHFAICCRTSPDLICDVEPYLRFVMDLRKAELLLTFHWELNSFGVISIPQFSLISNEIVEMETQA